MMWLRMWLGVCALGLTVSGASAAGLRPSWECLPPDTAFMMRVPQLAEFWKMIQTRTKFGNVALSPKRLEGLWQTIATIKGDDGETSFEELEKGLRKYGLESSDLMRILDAEFGVGVIVRKQDGREPVTPVLVWCEPGDDAAAKLLAAARQKLEEEGGDGEDATQRIDLELAGHDVTLAIEPKLDIDDADLPEDEDLENEDGDSVVERMKDAQLVKVGEQHTYITAIGGRLLVGTTSIEFADGDTDLATAQAEEARRIFAMFLESHASDGEPALATVLREPALAGASLPGMPLVEAVIWLKPILAAAASQEGDEESDVASQLAMAGIDDIGGIVLRQAFDDGRWRSAIAMTLPAPRHGMLEILDQPCDASEVPAFVTREVADFSQLSLDLGAAYKTIRQVIVAQADGEQLTNMFSVADVQSQSWLGVDVATVLSGLGSRHWILSFPPQVAEAIERARAAEETGEDTTQLADRLAVVWQVADGTPFVKLVGRLAQLAGGQLEEEQGFQGVRIPGGAAVYVGRGHLVVAMGDGTIEKTLAAIRTPPDGDASLRESDVPQRAAELLQPRPSRMYSVSDSTRTGGTFGALRDLAAVMEPDDIEDESLRAVFVALKELLPTAREMEGMLGIGAANLRMTDDGMLLESAWEMPAP